MDKEVGWQLKNEGRCPEPRTKKKFGKKERLRKMRVF